MAGEGEVAAVVGRHSHDGARTVTHQHIVSNPNGQLGTRDGVDAVGTREGTAHLADLSHTFAFAAVLGAGDILLHLSALLRRGDFLYQLMLRSQHHKGRAKQSVRTRRKHL